MTWKTHLLWMIGRSGCFKYKLAALFCSFIMLMVEFVQRLVDGATTC